MLPLQPVFRFAPSPNGLLHLGHAYSALLNAALARDVGGRFLVRIEDIDTIRCKPELVAATLEDLRWLGLEWEEPVLRQSEHFGRYRAALSQLEAEGLVYPCFCSRKHLLQAATAGSPRDPDGAVLYEGRCKHLASAERAARIGAGEAHALRLDMTAALARISETLTFDEHDRGPVTVQPQIWGDVVLGRKETPTSYHLSVVLDDAMQGVSDVVRGVDLFAATAVHRLLQAVFGLPVPRYRHHALLTDDAGQKLAKSRLSTPLRQLRAEGVSAAQLRQNLGF